MKTLKTILVVGIVALTFFALVSSAVAKTTYTYFESIGNCGEGVGGYVAVESNPDGSGGITILCDGGQVIQL